MKLYQRIFKKSSKIRTQSSKDAGSSENRRLCENYLKNKFFYFFDAKTSHGALEFLYMNSALEQQPMLHFSKMDFPAEWDPSSCTHATMRFLVLKWVCRGRYNTILSLPNIGKNDVSHLSTALLESCALHTGRCSRQIFI